MNAREGIRVVIVDDHPLFRDGLRLALGEQPDLVVVGEAGTGREGRAVVERLRPDVVLLDLDLPDGDGTDVVRDVVRAGWGAVLVVTMHAQPERLFAAVAAGASGYLVKGVGRDVVLAAVRTVAAGGAVFGPEVAPRLLGAVSAVRPVVHEAAAGLTPREAEVLALLAEGLGDNAIGVRLGLSAKTVRNHVSSVATKLHASSRAELVAARRAAGR